MEISPAMHDEEGVEGRPAMPSGDIALPPAVEPDDVPRSGQPQPGSRRGRPWEKGRTGNPAGRPPKRAHQAHYIARSLIARQAVPLTRKMIDLALAGDKAMLRLCHQSIAPPRREAPIDLQLPPVAERADLKAMMVAIADAAARGTMTAAQARTLVRMLDDILCRV
jgi:hypothetical protein